MLLRWEQEIGLRDFVNLLLMYCPRLSLRYALATTITGVKNGGHLCSLINATSQCRLINPAASVSAPATFNTWDKLHDDPGISFPPSAHKSWILPNFILLSFSWNIICRSFVACSWIELFQATIKKKKKIPLLSLSLLSPSWEQTLVRATLPCFSAVTLLSLNLFIPLLHLVSSCVPLPSPLCLIFSHFPPRWSINHETALWSVHDWLWHVWHSPPWPITCAAVVTSIPAHFKGSLKF